MIGISFMRILRTAFQNLWRNIWLAVATLIITTITLLMMSVLYFANIFGVQVLQNIEDKVDLSVIFKENVQEQYITTIAQEVRARQDVQAVTIVTSAQALDIFRQRHVDDPLIEESLQELQDNPLPATMYIVATEPRFYQNIAQSLEAEKYSPFIDRVNYENSRGVIERLIAIISSVKNIGFLVTVTFALLVVLIMFNTVRLAIYSFREEIDIMRLVGASRWFIQGPFVIEAVIVAVVAVGVASTLIYPALKAVAPQLQRFFFDTQESQFNIYQYALEHWTTVIGLQMLLAVGLAIFSSLIAVRRYLRD
ncbi:MAG: permease-like cell division protein FtsX [Candidatus Andersenbacteria bacterium]